MVYSKIDDFGVKLKNDRRSLNVTQGMRRAIKEGRWPRQAPIGYKNARDESNRAIIIPDPLKANLVREAFQEMAQGHLSQQEVRLKLMKKGMICSKNNFSRMLRNIFYIGKILIPPYNEEPKEVVNGIHEPIVDEMLFFKVLEVIDGKAKKHKRNVKNQKLRMELPLRGYVLCEHCGHKLTGSVSKGNGGRYYYYHCNYCEKARYPAKRMNADFNRLLNKLEPDDRVVNLYKTIIDDLKGQSKQQKAKERSIRQREINILREKIEKVQDKLINGDITSEDFNQIKRRYQTKLDAEESRLKELFNDAQNKKLQQGIEKILNLKNLYENSDLQGKDQIIGSIFPRKFVFSENKVQTDEINEVIRWMIKNNKVFRRNKKGQQLKAESLSRLVIRCWDYGIVSFL